MAQGRRRSRRYNPDFLNRIWNDAAKQSKLEGVSLYDGTRRSVINQKKQEGWDDDLIGQLVGNKSNLDSYKQPNLSVLRARLGG